MSTRAPGSMSAGSRTEPDEATADWRPTASLARLRLRADLRRKLRAWFDDRAILEVETPAWMLVTDETNDGEDAARSPALGNSQILNSSLPVTRY